MNTQKLKELLEQAGFDVERLLAPHPGGFPKDDFLVLESFAKLIVDECMDQCFTDTDAENIAKHFGVEE
jgi:hypothetical protein